MQDYISKYAVTRLKDGKYYFSKFHDSIESAMDEAMRLAKLEQSQFLVLKVFGVAKLAEHPVEWSDV